MTELTDAIRDRIREQLTAPRNGRSHRPRGIIRKGPEGKVVSCHTSMYPYRSDAIGVTLGEIEGQEDLLRRAGCSMEFDRETGEAIVTSAAQFQHAAKIMGLKTGRDGYENVGSGRDNAKRRAEIRRHVDRWADGDGSYPDDMPKELREIFD